MHDGGDQKESAGGGVRMNHKEKISCQLENHGQMEGLYQNIMSDLKTVQEAKRLLGHDCFTDEAEEIVEILEALKKLYKFSAALEDFNEGLQEMFEAGGKTARRLRWYIGRLRIKRGGV